MKKQTTHNTDFGGLLGFIKTYLRQLRRYMVTGLLVWVPLIVTLWLSWWVITTVGFGLESFIAQVVAWFNRIGDQFPAFTFLSVIEYSPGLGFLIAILLFLTTGFLTRYIVGRKLIAAGENYVRKIPGFRRIYTAVQQIRDVFVNREGTIFQKVVLLEYPRRGIVSVGFVTCTEQGEVQRAAGRSLTAVFVPTTPNPTSGFLLYLPPEELRAVDMSVEDAMKLIVSGGAFLPGKVAKDTLGPVFSEE